MKQLTIFKSAFFLLISTSLFLASCSKDKDKDMAVESVPFSGNYLVVEPSETYTLNIVSKGGGNYQIKEFGGFLNVGLNAKLDGSVLKIPSQTFTNPNGTSITIVGTGTLSTKVTKDDTITFDYAISGFTSYTGDFSGTRK
jgi:hypothetical protein